MEKNIRVIGQISVILLFVVFLWQGSWLYKVRKMKIEEVHENANYILKSILDCYLSNEELILFSEKCELSVSLNEAPIGKPYILRPMNQVPVTENVAFFPPVGVPVPCL